MNTGYRGMFVTSWSQTEIDGVCNPDIRLLRAGATWRWSGQPLRVDGPNEILLLDGAQGEAELRKRAARTVRRLMGVAKSSREADDRILQEEPGLDSGFMVTDGRKTHTVNLISAEPGSRPLLVFLDDAPPRETDLWVVRSVLPETSSRARDVFGAGVICFTPGTLIRTPEGDKPVETLCEGDRIQTKDDGAQEIHWIGKRHMTGARLYAMPSLRPVRIRAGALGEDEPVGDLLVSPQHRMLIHGGAAQALFNTPEVLVAASDLLNDNSILVDHTVREVTYIHLLLERHQVVWANGVETESFHPANTSIQTIEDSERARLLEILPAIGNDPQSYGDYARRNLSSSEAEILRFEGPLRH